MHLRAVEKAREYVVQVLRIQRGELSELVIPGDRAAAELRHVRVPALLARRGGERGPARMGDAGMCVCVAWTWQGARSYGLEILCESSRFAAQGLASGS